MDTFIFGTILGYAAAVLIVALIVVLVYMLVRTRNPGFLWLCIAVILWPILCYFVENSVIHALGGNRQPVWFPANLIKQDQLGTFFIYWRAIEKIVKVLLLFIASLYFFRRTLPKETSAPLT
ncbi:MAG TPA: hypothetical protein VHY48_14060 [Acidobacteriaceae bacterium]|nr:hypothetical protein [Acidobacteriaceae bacterium]